MIGKVVIIGENGNMGIPISAIQVTANNEYYTPPPVRWRLLNKTFILECLDNGEWRGVPVVIPSQDIKDTNTCK